MKRHGLDNARCAARLCVSEVTFTQWSTGAKVMPAGAWKLLRYELGMLETPAAKEQRERLQADLETALYRGAMD